MTHNSPIKLKSVSRFALMILALAFAGCNRDKVTVQQVPKDSDQTTQPLMSQTTPGMPANPHAGMDMSMSMDAGAKPKLKYTLPTGWKEKDLGQMRVASFDAPGKDGQNTDVSVIPLGAMPPDAELQNLNMWRKAVGLTDVEKVQSEPVAIGSAQGKLYEVGGENATGRIVVAVLDKDGMSWYFKMSGPDAGVRDQKPAFLDFLKSVSFEAAPAMASANPHATMPTMAADAAPADTAAGNSNGSLPAGWKEIPNAPMLAAKYVIQGSGDAKAEVNVSMLNGTGGGVLPNVLRWRVQQLNLPPITEDELSKQAQSVDIAGTKATLVDMTGTDKSGKKARMIGIIAPQANDTWFYKLMGDPQVVEQQKDVFMKFLQTAKFSNAP
jgi:hypothetical protein